MELHSLETSPEESTFLHRELGLTWHYLDELKLGQIVASNTELGLRTLVAVSDIERYKNFFMESTKDSIVVFLLGDESYNPRVVRLLGKSDAVHCVFRNYDINQAALGVIIQKLFEVFLSLRSEVGSYPDFIKIYLTGLRTAIRMLNWRRQSKAVHVIPLGYTNKFINALCDLGFLKGFEGSLFSEDNPLRIDLPSERHFAVTFRGVRGQLQRRIALQRLMKSENADIKVSDGAWAGFLNSDLDGGAYVLSLMNSKIALCPPGYLNNESFRYYEALICGAYPLEDSVAMSHLGICPARPKRNEIAGISDRLDLIRESLITSRELIRKSLIVDAK